MGDQRNSSSWKYHIYEKGETRDEEKEKRVGET